MKKRALCWLLVLVMVASLLPASVLAIERPGEGYVAITSPTQWMTNSNYDDMSYSNSDSSDLYALYDGEYYPVKFKSGSVYEDAGAGWKADEVADYGQTLYYKDGSTYTATSYDKVQWWKNLGNSVRIYGNFTYDSTKFGNTWNLISARESDGGIDNTKGAIWTYTLKSTGEPFWHKIYSCSVGSFMEGYYLTLYYYTNAESGSSISGGRLDSYSSSGYNTAVSNGTITLMGTGKEGYGWTWGGGNWTATASYYTHGDMYIPKGISNYYNKLSAGNTVLAWPEPGSQYSYEYSGHLYKLLTQQKAQMYITVNGSDVYLTETPITDAAQPLYNGTLYYHSDKAPLPTPTPQTIINTEESGEDGVYTHKDLTANGDAYDITLTAYTTGNEVTTSSQTITPTVKPMDIVMVIDQSGSMATRDMGNEFVASSQTSWTVDQATSGQTHYVKVGNSYYPVQASTGYIYEQVESAPRASDMLNDGDDAISLGVNGAPTYYNITTDYYVMYNGELHPLYLITAGLFLQYGLYPYIYVNNNDVYSKAERWKGNNYWVAVFDPWDGSDLRDNNRWDNLASAGRISFVNTDGQAIGGTDKNADSARLSYSWFTSSDRISNLYKLSDTKVANQLYYVDSAGVRHNLGSAAQFEGDVVYQNEEGPLYVGNSTSRVDALKAAVTEFANTVQTNAKQFGVDHRMAFVGFAGNKVPAYSLGADATTVGSNGLADYTNTGLFFNGGFENYEKITGYDRTTDQYINRHYYQSVSGSYVPVKYSDGWKRLDLTTGATTSTSYSSSNWYKATYEGNGTSLSAADYRAALVSVNNNDALNSNISTAISQFAANGGTYTSYGMTMAEQLYKAVEDAGDTQGVDSEGQTVDRQRVIIVFTDGEPGANGYDSSIAGEALVSGNLAKTEQGAIVYTVGLFKSAPSSQVADFMKKLSSEYQMSLNPVYGGNDNANYSLGDLDPNKTYYYKNETTGKYYAVTTEYGTGSSLGWWIYNGSASGHTESYTLTNPKRSTGAGSTVFYNASGSSVNGENVKTGTTYYTSGGDKIVYEYRWFDSDRSIKNPALQSGQSTSAGESRVQFYDLAGTVANDDGLSYYMTASNAAELNNVFAQIAGTIVSEETTIENGSAYTEDTMYVMDEISADFDLPADLSATNNHVTVYADTVSEWNADGSPKTYNESTTPLRQGDAAAIAAGTADVEVVWNGKKVQINYFDFGRLYMQQSNPNAARIRVVIDGVRPNKAGEKLYSNTAQSGLYYKDPESGAVTMVEAFNRPYISVPGYTVKWVDDQGTNMDNPYDQDTDLIKDNVPVYDGTEPTKDSVVVENVSRTDYTFDGWSTTPGGAKVIDITRDAETGNVTSYGVFSAVVDSDVTYYAHFASEVKNFYTATWFNGTTQLFEQKGLANGDVPEYGGTIPTKSADDDNTYFFAGWYNEEDHNTYGDSYDEDHVITQLPAINNADVKYYAVFAPMQIETRNIVLEYNTKTLIQGETVTGYDAMNTPGGDFSLEKAENAASGNFFFTPGTQRNKQYNPAEAGKYKFDVTGFAEVNSGVYYEGDKPTKVNVIPAADVYFDDDLDEVEADLAKTNKSGDYKVEYRVDQADIPESTDAESVASGRYEITFTGTGIDVYCTTDTTGGYVSAKLTQNGQAVAGQPNQTIRNYDKEVTRYNVPSISFTGLDYGTYVVTLNVLSSSNYKLDGIRVYGAVNDQTQYTGTHEQYAAYINMREALVNDNGVDKAFTNEMEEEDFGVLFVDDSSKLIEERQQYDAQTHLPIVDESGNPVYGPAYKNLFEAYQANSPKHEIYLDSTKQQEILFKLTADGVRAAANGNLWIGLSAPDKNKNTGTVTLKEGKTIEVTSGVDMYYPITSDMIGDNGVVTIKNTGSSMISVTNLKITGNETIYNAVQAAQPANSEDAAPASLADAMPLVFEQLTMQAVKIAANNGVDPDAPADPGTGEPDDPGTPDQPDDPGADKPTWTDPMSLLKTLFQALLNTLGNLFKGLGGW